MVFYWYNANTFGEGGGGGLLMSKHSLLNGVNEMEGAELSLWSVWNNEFVCRS